MKRRIAAIALVFAALLMSGCTNKNYGQRPWDFTDSEWYITAPDLYFRVTENSADKDKPLLRGELTTDGTAVKIFAQYDDTQISFYTYETDSELSEKHAPSDALFSGKCKFSEKVFTVIVDFSAEPSVIEGSSLFFVKK